MACPGVQLLDLSLHRDPGLGGLPHAEVKAGLKKLSRVPPSPQRTKPTWLNCPVLLASGPFHTLFPLHLPSSSSLMGGHPLRIRLLGGCPHFPHPCNPPVWLQSPPPLTYKFRRGATRHPPALTPISFPPVTGLEFFTGTQVSKHSHITTPMPLGRPPQTQGTGAGATQGSWWGQERGGGGGRGGRRGGANLSLSLLPPSLSVHLLPPVLEASLCHRPSPPPTPAQTSGSRQTSPLRAAFSSSPPPQPRAACWIFPPPVFVALDLAVGSSTRHRNTTAKENTGVLGLIKVKNPGA